MHLETPKLFGCTYYGYGAVTLGAVRLLSVFFIELSHSVAQRFAAKCNSHLHSYKIREKKTFKIEKNR